MPMQRWWLSSFRFLVRENSARVPAEPVVRFALTNLYGSLTILNFYKARQCGRIMQQQEASDRDDR